MGVGTGRLDPCSAPTGSSDPVPWLTWRAPLTPLTLLDQASSLGLSSQISGLLFQPIQLVNFCFKFLYSFIICDRYLFMFFPSFSPFYFNSFLIQILSSFIISICYLLMYFVCEKSQKIRKKKEEKQIQRFVQSNQKFDLV